MTGHAPFKSPAQRDAARNLEDAKVNARRAREQAARAEGILLDAVVDAIAHDLEPGIAGVARALGVSRNTVYARLAARQDRADQLGHTETPPSEEAPADEDRDR